MEEHENEKDLSKTEAQFSKLKSYVLVEISALGSKMEQISNSVNTALKKLKSKDNRNTGIPIYWENISLFCKNNNYIQERIYKVINVNLNNDSCNNFKTSLN